MQQWLLNNAVEYDRLVTKYFSFFASCLTFCSSSSSTSFSPMSFLCANNTKTYKASKHFYSNPKYQNLLKKFEFNIYKISMRKISNTFFWILNNKTLKYDPRYLSIHLQQK